MMSDTLYVIPARGGSKGLPGKNIKPLLGKPLIGYAIDTARSLTEDAHICVTTDDQEIINTVENYGLKVPFVRPAELATDTAGSYEVIKHALDHYKNSGATYKKVVLLQPTSPFRNAEHVKAALALYTGEEDMVVSVKETHANPYYLLAEENKDGWLETSKPATYERRQDAPVVYEYNGAVYVMNVASLEKYEGFHQFTKKRKMVMDAISSVDVDTPMDWEWCEFLISKGYVSL